MRRWVPWMLALALCLAPAGVAAHELLHTLSRGEAVVITLTHPGGGAVSQATFEVFAPDDTGVFQTGRTDAAGRAVFVPDRPGRWRVQVFTRDGHGTEITVEVDEAGKLSGTDTAAGGGIGRIVVGVAVILGVFGTISLFLAKKKR